MFDKLIRLYLNFPMKDVKGKMIQNTTTTAYASNLLIVSNIG